MTHNTPSDSNKQPQSPEVAAELVGIEDTLRYCPWNLTPGEEQALKDIPGAEMAQEFGGLSQVIARYKSRPVHYDL